MIRFLLIAMLFSFSCLLQPHFAFAQEEPDSTSDTVAQIAPDNAPGDPAESSATVATPMTRLELSLSITVLAFGLAVILLEIFLIKTKRISAEDTIKFIIITLIITATLFLITAGYSNDQIAPAIGLLGTIAGYLLGRIHPTNTKTDENETAH